MRAITHAQTVISWQENLLNDEMPPEWMWPFDEELEGWFDEVERKRNERYGGSGGDGDVTPARSQMTDNEYAKALRG